MVVDREARDIAVPLVCGLRDGKLTNDDFEAHWPTASLDCALMAVSATLWGAYSDNCTHTIDGLTEEWCGLFDRSALFLESALEYEWPTYRFYASNGIPVWALVASLGLLVPLYGWLRRRFDKQEAAGESSVWPFIRCTDYERERARMPPGDSKMGDA
jgi:hypothetical protein